MVSPLSAPDPADVNPKEAGMPSKAPDKRRTRILLEERDLPTRWYNIQADLKSPAPPVLHPGTGQPIGPQDLAPLFPMELIKQEVSQQRWIPIPEEVRDVLRLWRPSPLHRAHRLEQALGTPARIYYKYEGVSPAGSHKPNTAGAQAYYNKPEGVARLSTETGAGQWGSALAFAAGLFGLQCKVYMVKVSHQQKPYRRVMMETWGAQVVASPSPDTQAGKKVLEQDPDSPGSLGIAISEAVEDAATRDDTKYSLGSVLNHVLMHQTVIGQEVKKQLAKVDDQADVVIACAGGGSNFAGLAFPFAMDKLTGKRSDLRIVAVEPTACPSLTKGKYVYDFGDTVGMTPLVKMHTLGHGFIPAPLHAGGLRYHGMAPLVCKLYDERVIEAVAVPQVSTFQAALQFARTEGIIPAPESAHAIRVAVDEALRCQQEGRARTIVFNLSGHGHFDLGAYEQFLAGRLQDYEYPAEKIEEALRGVPEIKI
jgi:tryptophan synthase beta chain